MTQLIIRDAMVAMRDGVRLATDVYLPADWAEGRPVPVLVERTPYDKRGTNHGDRTAADPVPRSKPEIAAQFVAAGYAYVLQDCRGRYRSEGEFTKYLNEAEDGYDTLAWIVDQPWCNGRIGTLGLSYCAHAQAAMATLNPPGLKAMVLDCGGFSSAYHGGVRQGGAFELKQLTWAYARALEAAETSGDYTALAALRAEDIGAWARINPWTPGHSPVAAVPEYESYVIDQWRHECFGPFWQQRGIYWRGFYDETADVPMIHISGWYDPYSQTAIDNFLGLRAAGRSDMRLVLGPWTHGQRSVSFAGDVDFGPQAPIDGQFGVDFVGMRRAWFDRHLKGMDVPEPLPARVMQFVMGGGSGGRTSEGRLDHGGRWRAEADWPPPSARSTAFHLHAGGLLSIHPAAPGQRDYLFDPAHPVPTLGGAITSGAPLMTAGAYDQSEIAQREDVLIFETVPLDREIELTGPVVARLFINSDAPDTDFTIKLLDIHPPSEAWPKGFAVNLSHGILRARFRHSFETPVPLEADRIESIDVHAFPTSNLFLPGHRIRLEVSSSSFPHFDVNPNKDWRDPDGAPRTARNRVFMGPEYPSHVLLPVRQG